MRSEADRSKDENQCRLAAEGALKELTNCPQSGSGENGAVKQVVFSMHLLNIQIAVERKFGEIQLHFVTPIFWITSGYHQGD